MSITDLTNNSFEEHIISFYYNEIAKSIKSKEEYKTILIPHLGKFVYNHRRHTLITTIVKNYNGGSNGSKKKLGIRWN